MATIQITQIPTETATYTGTSNTYDELVPTNYWQMLPVTVNITDNLATYFNVKYILRVYDNSISDANLLATIKQRTNNKSTTTNQVAIFDIKRIVNTVLKHSYEDTNAAGKEIHKVGKNLTSTIFSENTDSVKTIILKATWERATSATSAPVEQTSDEVRVTMYFTQATFPLMTYATLPDSNPLSDYTTANNLKQLMSNAPSMIDFRKLNAEPGGGSTKLTGYINYITNGTDWHTIGIQNKSGWGSDGGFLGLQYYGSDGTLIATYTFPNDDTRGGEPPASSNSDKEYLIYAGVGTGNFENYVGQAHKNNAALATFDGQPSGSVARDFAYYRVYMCDNQNGTSSIRSQYYYFVRDFESAINCKDQQIIRLAWINELGAWDYYNFNAGQTETVSSEKNNYQSVLGSSSLDTGDVYSFNTWGAGTKTLTTKRKLQSTLQTQYISEEEADFLETLFSSNAVMVIENLATPVSQSVVVTNKSFQRMTTAKNKLQIQYTFTIEYANPLNTNS